jgi:hypothetical protein
MSRAVFTLTSKYWRQKAAHTCLVAPEGATVTIKENKRSLPQNDRLHAMLTDIAAQLVWHGQKWPMDDWKKNLLACFKTDVRIMPRADGFGVVPVGGTSDLTVAEAGDFMTFIEAFGAQHGVVFHDTDPKTNATEQRAA